MRWTPAFVAAPRWAWGMLTPGEQIVAMNSRGRRIANAATVASEPSSNQWSTSGSILSYIQDAPAAAHILSSARGVMYLPNGAAQTATAARAAPNKEEHAVMVMAKVRCHGPCKQRRPVDEFPPAELRCKWPICKACRRAGRRRTRALGIGRSAGVMKLGTVLLLVSLAGCGLEQYKQDLRDCTQTCNRINFVLDTVENHHCKCRPPRGAE